MMLFASDVAALPGDSRSVLVMTVSVCCRITFSFARAAIKRCQALSSELAHISVPCAKRAQILKIICKNLKLEQTMDYDENANLALGYVAAVTTAIKRMLTERERQQLLVERRKTDQDRLKQLAKKVVVDDKVMKRTNMPTPPKQ
ncbi:hypothetical protein quinque_002407 [Culex quinquefasciatus]